MLEPNQEFQKQVLHGLVGHIHHCSVCGDEKNLFLVDGKEIFCQECMEYQRLMFGTVFEKVEEYYVNPKGDSC